MNIDRESQLHVLTLLEEALRADISFLAQDPGKLFQCLWNQCWWYDCSDAVNHYEASDGSGSRWSCLRSKLEALAGRATPQTSNGVLANLLESWRQTRAERSPGFVWLRSLRPPIVSLGTGQRVLLRGQVSGMSHVAFSPNCERIAVTASGSLRIWDSASGAEQLTIHNTELSCAAFSPDGRTIVTGGSDRMVRIWDAFTGEQLLMLAGHSAPVSSVAFSPCKLRVVSGGGCSFSEWGAEIDVDPTVRVWEIDSGREALRLTKHKRPILSVSFSPDGRSLVSVSSDLVRICDSVSEGELVSLPHKEYENDANAAAISPDGRYLAVGTRDGQLEIVDVHRGTQSATWRGHEGPVSSVAFFPDCSQLASGSSDQTVRIWSVRSGEQTASLIGQEGAVRTVAVSRDGTQVFLGSEDGTVRLWTPKSSALGGRLVGHSGKLTGVAFSGDGTVVATASEDKTLRVWDSRSGFERSRFTIEVSASSLCFSPDCRWILFGGGTLAGTVDVLTGSRGISIKCDGSIRSVGFSRDGAKIVCGSEQNITVHDAIDGRKLARLSGDIGPAESVAFSANSELVVSGHGFRPGSWCPEGTISEHFLDYSVRVWEVATGGEKLCLRGHDGPVVAVAFSQDDRLVVSASEDKTVRIWSPASGDCLEVIEGMGDVTTIASGQGRFPWRLAAKNLQTEIRSSGDSAVVGCLPVALKRVATHPDGRTFAGISDRHFHLFSLEGESMSPDS